MAWFSWLYRAYRIQPLTVNGDTFDGVYETSCGKAWLGKVYAYPNGTSFYVQLWMLGGKRIPAPLNWHELVIEQLI